MADPSPRARVPLHRPLLLVVVGDLGAGSVIEAAVDGVLVEKPVCDDDPGCPGDFDDNGVIDVNDILHLIANWGGAGGDVDGNGTTDVNDLLELLSIYGATC